MQKLLALLLAVMLVFSLAACGEKEETPSGGSNGQQEQQSSNTPDNDPDTSQATNNGGETANTTPDLDFAAIMAGNGAADTVWGKQDEATKQHLITEGKKDGYDISFSTDGSMTVVDPVNGETMIQNPDGTWNIKSEDGTVGQYGGNWPENEFTKLLPKPDMELLAASTNEDAFTVGFKDATLKQVKAYVEKVKEKGFTVDEETNEQVVGEMVIFHYTAKNTDGYIVEVNFAMGTSAVLLEKP